MSYLWAVLFGLGWGVLIAWIDTRTRHWLPYACAALVFLAAVIPLLLSGEGEPLAGVALALTAALAAVLAAGALWKGHPALQGKGYAERVRTMALKGSAIRAHREELPRDPVDPATPDDRRSRPELTEDQ